MAKILKFPKKPEPDWTFTEKEWAIIKKVMELLYGKSNNQ